MADAIRIAIVGAGVSGLSTHHRLEQEAKARGLDVTVETWDPKPDPESIPSRSVGGDPTYHNGTGPNPRNRTRTRTTPNQCKPSVRNRNKVAMSD